MGDVTIAQDIIEGVVDVMEEVGTTFQLKYSTYGPNDPAEPGADTTLSETLLPFEGFRYSIESKDVDGTNILEGDAYIIVSVSGMTVDEIKAFKPDNVILFGTETMNIVSDGPIEVAGIVSVIIVQVRS